MVWNNQISLADIISILALLGTLVTLILLLVQRSDSARPYVCIRVNDNIGTLVVNNKGLKLNIKDNAIQICCFGNGLANEVEVESYFLLDRKLDFYKKISIKGGIATLRDDGNKLKALFMVRPIKDYFEIINSNESINMVHTLNGKLLGMSLCGFDAVSQHNEKMIPVSVPCVFFRVHFYDMFGKSYNSYFQLQSMFNAFSKEEYSFTFKCKSLKKKEFTKLIELYKKQNCCGWFTNDFVPSYDQKQKK